MSTDTFTTQTLLDAVAEAQVLYILSQCDHAGETVLPPRREGGKYPYVVLGGAEGSRNGVVLDGDASSKNRMEDAIRIVRERSGEYTADAAALANLNHATVNYPNAKVLFSETDVANRLASTHFASATLSGSTTYAAHDPAYNEALLNGPGQQTALIRLSPFSSLLGVWHSLVKNGVQHPSLVRASTVATLAEQGRDRNGRFLTDANTASGYRQDRFVDSATENGTVTAAQTTAVEEIRKNVFGSTITCNEDGDKSGDKNKVSAVGLGNIGIGGKGGVNPDMSVGVAVSSVVRTMSVSLSLARRIHYPNVKESIAVRAALVSLAVYLDRLAARDLHLRAGCDLTEVSTELRVDTRVFTTPTVSEAREVFLSLFADAASAAGWNGSIYQLTGNPKIEGILK